MTVDFTKIKRIIKDYEQLTINSIKWTVSLKRTT